MAWELTLGNLPVRQFFYLDYTSYPIALGLERYKVLETRVSRVSEKNGDTVREYYRFDHLVEHPHPDESSRPPFPESRL